MKFRHAAAIALVGWYLMTPYHPGDFGEALSKWSQSNEFDTEAECNDLLDYDRGLYLGNHSQDHAVQEQIRRLRYARCVDANDPSLIEK